MERRCWDCGHRWDRAPRPNRGCAGRTRRVARFSVAGRALSTAGVVLSLTLTPAIGQDVAAQAADSPEDVIAAAERTAGIDKTESLFSTYLHLALIGRFSEADSFARAFLDQSEFNPLSPEGTQKLLMLTDKYQDSIDTLLLIINNTSIGDNARKILELIREAHRRQRKAPNRIEDSIRLLAGTPTQHATGLARLMDSGEYAVPWMLRVLADPGQQDLHFYVKEALPKLGKKALNPLIAALEIPNPQLTRLVAETLGKIGYPQSLPYLKRLTTDEDANAMVRGTAESAIVQIVVADPAVTELPADVLFANLAESYYADVDSLRADPREDQANVWVIQEDFIAPIEVPREIFHLVMAMRAARASLELDASQPNMVALWLAADFKREAALGLDVESQEVAATADLTRPSDFPRSVYFARCAGPSHCQLVLKRALRDRDREVALGAIAALNATAGPVEMVNGTGAQGISLAKALAFPDLLVRIRAALAIGRAMPSEPFRGADEVVPVLASAMELRGERFYLVVDPDEASRGALAEGLSRTPAEVVAAVELSTALTNARETFTHLDGIFLASDLQQPAVTEALTRLHNDERFALTPVVVYIKEGDNLVAAQVAERAPRAGRLLMPGEQGAAADAVATMLIEKLEAVAPRYGYQPLDAKLAAELALEAADVLGTLALRRDDVFDVRVAEPALIQALVHPSEALPLAAIDVLALLDTPQAQQAVATVALDADQSATLRTAAYAALAASARQFGSHLEPTTVETLIERAFNEPDLALRTAASQALGAIDLPDELAARLIIQSR